MLRCSKETESPKRRLPPSDMELYELRSFAAVAEHGHLTRAAERLHVSQPAVSARIRALEDELVVALFERGASGMTITLEGSTLLPLASRVIGAAADLKSRARSLEGEVAALVALVADTWNDYRTGVAAANETTAG